MEESIDNKNSYDMIIGRGGIKIVKEAIGIFNLSKENFFTDENPNGVISKDFFLKLLYTLKRGQLISWQKAFDLMKDNIHIEFISAQRPETEDRTSILCFYNEDGLRHQLRLYLSGDLYRLIWQYSFSMLNCSATLEELYTEAIYKP